MKPGDKKGKPAASLLTKRLCARKLFLLEEGYYPKKNDCADDGGHNLTENSGTPVDSKPTKDVATDETAEDTDDDVDEQSVAITLENLASKPTGKGTEKNRDKNTHNGTVLGINGVESYKFLQK